MEPQRLRSEDGAKGEGTGIVVPLKGRPQGQAHGHERQRALARAIAVDVDVEAVPLHLDGTQPQVMALLSRLASCPGVRHASLWTCSGGKLAAVACREDDPADLGVLMGAVRAVADLALDVFGAGRAEIVTTTAAGIRIEMRVLESRFLLIHAVDNDVPPERVQPVVNSMLCSLRASLPTR